MKRLTGATILRTINVQATSPEIMEHAQQALSDLLRQRHRILGGRDDDFTVRNQQEIAEVATAQSKTMFYLLVAIAIVSLVVGGIGIMNIMLVSVTERTREIGIRIAIGAHGRDILLQFLIEAVTLSCMGGFIGIIIGYATAETISHFAKWPTTIPFIYVLLAFLSSAVVGRLFVHRYAPCPSPSLPPWHLPFRSPVGKRSR
jgi:putative ABC transport system permease protein